MEKIDLGIAWQGWPEKYEFSVTQMLHYLNDKFEKEKQAQALFEKQYNLEGAKYFGMRPEDIIKKWDDTRDRAIDLGHALDSWVGAVVEPEKTKWSCNKEMWKERFGQDEEMVRIAKSWKKYWDGLEELGYKLVAREQHMHKDYNGHCVSGKPDIILYYPPSNTILIIDWKTTDKLVSATKRLNPMYGPDWAKAMTQEKLTHSGLQCCVYRDMLEDLLPKDKVYNIETAIVNIKKDGSSNTYPHPVDYDKDRINELVCWCINKHFEDPDWEKDMKV